MFKKVLNQIKSSVKRAWDWVWSKTTVDEKATAVVKATKQRVKRVKEEMRDVADAISEVADQAGDVVDAAKGKKRRGRPRKKK
tara:strand:- start:136 stop:384 length:249 start_codon:yes stop_codon:yes gene_type:complete